MSLPHRPLPPGTGTNSATTQDDDGASSASQSLPSGTAEAIKLSSAEIKTSKQLKQQEKQARRAAIKGGVLSQSTPASSSFAPRQSPSTQNTPNQTLAPKATPKSALNPKAKPPPSSAPVQTSAKPAQDSVSRPIFDHLSSLTPPTLDSASKEVDRAVLAFGSQLSSFALCGSTARTLAMLQVFKTVIFNYKLPPGTAMSIHFSKEYLGTQIEFIKSCRATSVGMGNAIRFLKDAVQKLDPSTPETEIKSHLYKRIDAFISDRIVGADIIIARETCSIILDTLARRSLSSHVLSYSPPSILTFANSSLVRHSILSSYHSGKLAPDTVILVVDSAPLHEGTALAAALRREAPDLIIDLHPSVTSLAHAIRRTSMVLLGVQTVQTDGSVVARSGSALVAIHAHANSIPCHVLCQTFKSSQDAALDSWSSSVAELFPARDFVPREELPAFSKLKRNLEVRVPLWDVVPKEYITSIVSEIAITTEALPPFMEGGDV